MKVWSSRKLLFFSLIVIALKVHGGLVTPSYADSDSSATSFFPTWKLMDYEQKRAFVAGYLFGRKDAAYVTELASSYIKDNPARAVQSLESIRALYQVAEISPENLVPLIDTFYSDPENHLASLSKAVSAASQVVH